MSIGHVPTRITRQNPQYIIILIDQSASMSSEYQDTKMGNREAAAFLVNRLLKQMGDKSIKQGEIRDYFYVSVLGYGYTQNNIQNALLGNLKNQDIVSISELYDNIYREEKLPDPTWSDPDEPPPEIDHYVWLEPISGGMTPMISVFKRCKKLVENWISKNTEGWAPIIFNISDGEANDGSETDLTDIVDDITRLDNAIGFSPLVYNISLNGDLDVIYYPSEMDVLPNRGSKLLYRISSEIPPDEFNMLKELVTYSEDPIDLKQGARGLVMNGTIQSLVDLFDVGSRVSQL